MEKEEYYPNALMDTYSSVKGYIYCVKEVEDSGFQTQISDAVTSEKPVVVVGCEFIEDAYEAICEAERNGLVRVTRYSDVSEKMMDWIKKTVTMEYREASLHPEYRFFLERKFGEVLNTME